jgi:outer membrane protein assembly factor BamB
MIMMRNKKIIIGLFILLLLTLASILLISGYVQQSLAELEMIEPTESIQLDNGPWPMYCHDQKHTCRSPYKGLTEQPVGPKWIYPSPGGIGGITSSIAIGSDKKIYAGSAQNEEFIKDKLKGYSGVLSAISPDGKRDWLHDSHRGTPMISMIESCPLLTSDGKVIYGKDDGHVYALNKKGELLWDFATDDPYDPKSADDNEQIIPSPILGPNNTLYILSIWDNVYTPRTINAWLNNPILKPIIDHYKIKGIKAQNWGKLYAVDVQTGKRKWVFDPSLEPPFNKKGFWGSPAIDDNGTIYVAAYDNSFNGYLYALNPDGALKWKYPKNTQEKIQNLQSPPSIGDDGTIYVGSGGVINKAMLYAFNPDGTLKWSFEISENRITSGPGIGPDGTLYFGSHNHPAVPSPNSTRPPKGYLYALEDLGTQAKIKYKFEVKYGITASPAIDNEGNVFFSTTSILPVPPGFLGDYHLYALDKNGKKLWSYPFKGFAWGSPSIDKDGTVYLGVIQGEACVVALGPGKLLKNQ